MSRSATRNEATRHVQPPKVTPFAVLPFARPYGARANGCERLRTVANGGERLQTVANGCERWRTVANGCERLRTVLATLSEHTLNPQTRRVKREPLLRVREKTPGRFPKLNSPMGNKQHQKKNIYIYKTTSDNPRTCKCDFVWHGFPRGLFCLRGPASHRCSRAPSEPGQLGSTGHSSFGLSP